MLRKLYPWKYFGKHFAKSGKKKSNLQVSWKKKKGMMM
jgi:hypothetical protein